MKTCALKTKEVCNEMDRYSTLIADINDGAKMTTLTEKIVDQALSLPNDMRAVVVDKLLESLNIPSHKEIDLLWAKEAEKRYKELKAKKAEAIDGKLVFEEIRKKYRR